MRILEGNQEGIGRDLKRGERRKLELKLYRHPIVEREALHVSEQHKKLGEEISQVFSTPPSLYSLPHSSPLTFISLLIISSTFLSPPFAILLSSSLQKAKSLPPETSPRTQQVFEFDILKHSSVRTILLYFY